MLRRLPDYTCSETIARSVRTEAGAPFRRLDTLRLQVGWIGGRERYGRLDSAGFEERELRDLVGRGLTSTGNFAGHVQHVFLSAGAEFTARGTAELRGLPAVRFDYEVPVEYSRYRIRGKPSAEVGIRGSFWLDSRTLDLLRMEVHADEIPPELGMSRLSEIVDYERKQVGDMETVLPVSSELTVLTLTGDEFRNQATFDACRQFSSESNIRFDIDDEAVPAAPASPPTSPTIARIEAVPEQLRVDLVLDSDIDPAKSAVDDEIRAVVAHAVIDSGRVLVPEGSVVQGRLVRVDRSHQPFEHYVIGLEFHTLETGNKRIAFFATMQAAGPAPGLMREAKRLDPVFTRRRTARLDILVREKPRGEGVLYWDARQPQIRRGLKMRWLTVDPGKLASNAPER